MSTIPLTLIEGSIALPRLRPFDRLPTPFGRDWALLPPGHSWRAELKALYAAVLRTFCMSDQTIFSFCRWVPLNARRASASASAATATRATVFNAPRDKATPTFAEAAALPTLEGRSFGTLSRGLPPQRAALAGGACALGGAAMLAWIAFGHLAHRHAIGDVKSAHTLVAKRDAQPAKLHLSDAVMTRQAATGEVSARTRSVAAARVGGAPTIGPASTSTKVTSVATVAPNASTHDALSRPAHTLRDRIGKQHKKPRRQFVRNTAANRLSQVAAMADDMSPIAIAPVAPRALPGPSAAGSYSPLAPARLGSNEYAGVTMSATTHLRDIAPPPSATSNNPSGSSGTEWMNHMSQRRVTEVPDQFTK